jgi:NitT/TauT family transport system ATP-binding protein
MALMVEVKNLGQTYHSSNGLVHALKDVSFFVKKGEFLSIVGPSGCGKSTLIKIIGDLIAPSEGSVSICGLTPRAARLQGMFSFVFQNPVLLPWRRVWSNVALPLEILRRKGRDPRALLQTVGLAGFEHRYPSELSGGMRQRAALARGLVFDPEVLFMDEPFASVDEITRKTLNDELLRLWHETRVTILFITHSIAEAVALSDRVLVLSSRPGRVKDIVDVPFNRPRTRALKERPEFQEVVKCLNGKLD